MWILRLRIIHMSIKNSELEVNPFWKSKKVSVGDIHKHVFCGMAHQADKWLQPIRAYTSAFLQLISDWTCHVNKNFCNEGVFDLTKKFKFLLPTSKIQTSTVRKGDPKAWPHTSHLTLNTLRYENIKKWCALENAGSLDELESVCVEEWMASQLSARHTATKEAYAVHLLTNFISYIF